MVGRRPGAAITLAHGGQVEAIDHLYHEAGQVPFGQPLVNRRGQQKVGQAIGRAEIGQAEMSGGGANRRCDPNRNPQTGSQALSPTGC